MNNQSDQINELATALSKAQAVMKGATKDSANPFFKSKYADIASVWEACRAALTENGLSVVQIPNTISSVTLNGESEVVTELFVLETTLLHSSGQWMKGVYPIKPIKDDPQGVGGAITYARRYSLAAIVGIAQEDDDGKAASKQPKIDSKIMADVQAGSLAAIEAWDKVALDEIWDEFEPDEHVVMWKRFNSQERSAMKKIKSGQEKP